MQAEACATCDVEVCADLRRGEGTSYFAASIAGSNPANGVSRCSSNGEHSQNARADDSQGEKTGMVKGRVTSFVTEAGLWLRNSVQLFLPVCSSGRRERRVAPRRLAVCVGASPVLRAGLASAAPRAPDGGNRALEFSDVREADYRRELSRCCDAQRHG